MEWHIKGNVPSILSFPIYPLHTILFYLLHATPNRINPHQTTTTTKTTMVRQDPHQGGSLSEMAATGTTIPNDAGKMNTIPSVPRPDQRAEHFGFDNAGIAEPSTAMAADNATDLPRSTRDIGQTGEVITGTGNSMPAGVESKHAYMGANHHAGHGDTRELKHAKYAKSEYERYQS
ncbi:unnamed protein product [Penicillium salamii]|uniref:Uncharacterized protein n=1 Tax=Penicillium salamii TaxID=1612424 RepID=A0A9W4IL71_9EURO|nr:unnamed protein product [Penicillium salamii]CAG8034439.1 unnamed protein product [Penicillium salamii]CAG8084332.1 unnamed protein product [Penicillium salamii]CAG8092348.1 unnamed protein product [Penicillium salamii]CAG8208065.1 unnamed protein product [Penicillium salamii]